MVDVMVRAMIGVVVVAMADEIVRQGGFHNHDRRYHYHCHVHTDTMSRK